MESIVHSEFENLYSRLREKEGRFYSDEMVASLPAISHGHGQYAEWQIRKNSSEKLVNYLLKRSRYCDILEIGCGNGWLSAKLSAIPGSMVTGIDVNAQELEQARRVFGKIPNLQFIHGELKDLGSGKMEFDVIVIAAAIQYFARLKEIIKPALSLLNQFGEIHIVDSHFYPVQEVADAKNRSRTYFESMGFPGMNRYYHHHDLEELNEFEYTIMYDPNGLFNRFVRNRNPFHWIRITAAE